MPSLTGKNALVTGGGTGIGYGCAEQLLRAGANVTLAGRREDVLLEAVTHLRALGCPGVADSIVCDITNETDVENAVRHAARGGNLDVLVANAGSGFPGAILQMGAEAWDFCTTLNVTGSALCIKHAGLLMKQHGGGSIIVISSTSGTKVQPWLAPYVVSKAALDMLAKCAAIELSPYKIRVNSVQPGYVPTEAMGAFTHGDASDLLTRATPLGRPGTPDDIGHMVAFLASDEAAWVTGQVLGVDGGLNIPVMPGMGHIASAVYGPDILQEYPLPDFTALNR